MSGGSSWRPRTAYRGYGWPLSRDSPEDENARNWGNRFLYAALAVQGAGIAMLVYQLKTLTNVVSQLPQRNIPSSANGCCSSRTCLRRQINAMGQQQLYATASEWIAKNGAQFSLSLNANPVELAALITAFTGTFFVVMFGIKTERIRALLPSADTLDGLMYKLAGVTFAGIALLLMTGAIWANESWGRYWGWDSKEVGALVAWLTYAGFLHSRIAYGWRGRRSAYFAVVAFLFVIFTYLGVSYLLPGLHSYA